MSYRTQVVCCRWMIKTINAWAAARVVAALFVVFDAMSAAWMQSGSRNNENENHANFIKIGRGRKINLVDQDRLAYHT